MNTYEISNHDRLKGLIEFSRAVHAEMDAITTAARIGNAPLKNSSLYCTTFPCHNCACHIIAAGITKVYYIEPYEKSLALELHEYEIEFEPKDESGSNAGKVLFLPFEGVAPKQYLNVFTANERKNSCGKRTRYDMPKMNPILSQFMETYLQYETKVMEHVKTLEE